MSEIYSLATKVIVWLGSVDPVCHVLERVQEVLNHHASKDGLTLRYYLEQECDFKSLLYNALYVLRQTQDAVEIEQVTHAAHILSKSEYWRRLWVMQEFRLARDVHIMFGKSSTTWTFWRAVYNFYVSGIDVAVKQPLNLLQLRSRAFGSLTAIEDVLELSKGASCTDVRDRLFGVLSLALDGDGFPIDYRDQPQDILLKAILHFHRQDLRNLASKLREALALPAPRYTDPIPSLTSSWDGHGVAASYRGHEAAVKILLDAGADGLANPES